ncbi:MAG: hypothetical protein IIV03_05900 [Clostridia bacterium]|nr:hypothetical protein [Clostridia bacterium]MBQ1934835.1 hypothetical protein [Clostridia bacterium]MBQ5649655.1 hypothetical protein [Clostridia bacterium]MBQ5809211.1 hypothetical protein [Clostridia bacterium]MBR0327796.1 hypothetical protein [Clostridia bacterium]
MRVIRISANNVRVEMSDEEAEKYGIDATAEAENGAARGTLRRLLEAVKSESGIDYCGERVSVRLLRSHGVCDMIISRLGVCESKAPGACVVRFPSVGALIAACRVMDRALRADACIGEIGAFLIIDAEHASKFSNKDGEVTDFAFCEEFVREHCKTVCTGDAIRCLSEL